MPRGKHQPSSSLVFLGADFYVFICVKALQQKGGGQGGQLSGIQVMQQLMATNPYAHP
jgi:hypothetical protein